MIRRASLRVRSVSLTTPVLSALMGVEPTDAAEAGSPVSGRAPDGPRRGATTWLWDSPLDEGSEFSGHLSAMQPLLDALDRARVADTDLRADVVMMIEARDLGSWVGVGADDVVALAAARCGLQLDCYSQDPDVE